MTATRSPYFTLASSAPWKPVVTMSPTSAAASRLTPSGIFARLRSASGTLKYSPNIPSQREERYLPPRGPPECWWIPSCMSRFLQTGVTAGTATTSPTCRSVTPAPTSTTRPTPSWPRILLGAMLGFFHRRIDVRGAGTESHWLQHGFKQPGLRRLLLYPADAHGGLDYAKSFHFQTSLDHFEQICLQFI